MGRAVKRYLAFFCLVFFLAAMTVIYVVQETRITGNSMAPALRNGESVLVDKLIYRRSAPERFDVVVFRYLYDHDEYYIKRVIGLPGETVQIRDGLVYIDGERLEDPYGASAALDAGRAGKPVTLGENEFFVLGDNRNFSTDSREQAVGNVKKSQILGKAVMRLRKSRG